jgi:cytochrome c553
MNDKNPEQPEVVLRGLDGSNPLAFLAALGTLRTLAAASPEQAVRMAWRVETAAWRPVLKCGGWAGDAAADELLNALAGQLAREAGSEAFRFTSDLKLMPAAFRKFALAARDAALSGDSQSRNDAAFAAAFACEGCINKDGTVQDTAFRTMSGAGHQHFVGTMEELAKGTDREHLRRTLFAGWDYKDGKPSLRFDPVDDRRYALRWGDPSGDATKTMRGANRLAVEALPLLPTCPVGQRLATTGFNVSKFWTWPIWEPWLTLDVTRTLLALEELQSQIPNRAALLARGVREVFRSERITVGKFRNFTPAAAV